MIVYMEISKYSSARTRVAIGTKIFLAFSTPIISRLKEDAAQKKMSLSFPKFYAFRPPLPWNT